MAVLVESDLGRLPDGRGYTEVVVVEADRDTRLARLLERGMSSADALGRMADQADDAQRRAVADHVITNDGDVDSLVDQVAGLWKALLSEG
jgi:dephospho-CoA kinase